MLKDIQAAREEVRRIPRCWSSITKQVLLTRTSRRSPRGGAPAQFDCGGSGIVSVVTHLMEPALTPQMLAEDGKTAIVLLQVSLEGREPVAVQESLGAMLEHLEVPHYYTGDWLINEDLIYSAQEGLKKKATNAIVYWIYTMAFDEFKTGRASALVMILFVIILLLTLVQWVVSRKKVHYEG